MLFVMLVVAGACKDRAVAAPDKAPQAPAVASGENRGSAAQPNSQDGNMVVVTADEAHAKQLPRIGMRVDPSGTELRLTKFPEPDKYLIASGPPGGPLLAIVWTTDEREADTAAVERAVKKHFSQEWQQPLQIGEAESVSLAGAIRAALSFTTGQSLRYTGWCGAIVSTKDSSILVTLGRTPTGGSKPTCAEVLQEPNLAAFARTFTVLP